MGRHLLRHREMLVSIKEMEISIQSFVAIGVIG
jgi:hypothetical protein